MEDLFKKFVYTGVGLVSLTAEKLQKSIDTLVEEEKISEKEGKKIVNDFFIPLQDDGIESCQVQDRRM